MELGTIQLGLDIATAVSVIAAATTFIVSNNATNAKNRENRTKEIRQKYLMEGVKILTERLKELKLFKNEIDWAIAEGKEFPSKNISNEAFFIIFTAEGLTKGAFSVFANESEMEALNTLIDDTKDFNISFVKALNGEGQLKPINDLIKILEKSIQTIADSIKKDI